MKQPLSGIRVVEVGTFLFVPSAAALLGDWGASVVKVEHPDRGDPLRGVRTPADSAGSATMPPVVQLANRGKRSIALDLERRGARPVLERLVADCDVFITNLLPAARTRLGIEVDDLRRVNPMIICAVGSAVGNSGPDRQHGGFEHSTFWARGGLADTFHPPALSHPPRMPGGMGDLMAGSALAGAIAAAIAGRERHGEPSTIDVSLLAMSAWISAPDLQSAAMGQGSPSKQLLLTDRSKLYNPLMGIYRTREGRFLALNIVQSERYWSELCQRLGCPGLADDPRFVDAAARATNAQDLVRTLDELFDSADLPAWRARLAEGNFAWEPVQTVTDLASDPQVIANGIIQEVEAGNGRPVPLISGPAQFDGLPSQMARAPEHGEHTEAVLLELGFDWDDISAFQEAGVLG